MAATKQLWDRLAEEPATWFARFKLFVSLGPTRDLEAAYRAGHGAQEGTAGHGPPAVSSGAWGRSGGGTGRSPTTFTTWRLLGRRR
jgi:hypothetical protein